jgi:hypothetical protein
LGEFGYNLFMKAANTWPLGKFILAKIKKDSDFGVVEKMAAKLTNLPMFVPTLNPSKDDLSLAAATTTDLSSFLKSSPNHPRGSQNDF